MSGGCWNGVRNAMILNDEVGIDGWPNVSRIYGVTERSAKMNGSRGPVK